MRWRWAFLARVMVLVVVAGAAAASADNPPKDASKDQTKTIDQVVKEPDDKNAPAKLRFSPGMQTQVPLPGVKGSMIVYVPTDYIPERRWPVIFNYHARYQSDKWQFANVEPFLKVTGGKGFVIVGMNYASKAFYASPSPAGVGGEVDAFREAWQALGKEVELSPKLIFLGGYSMGGFAATAIGEKLMGNVAGLVLLSGGRFYLNGGNPPPAELVRGKCVFVGVGAEDAAMLPVAQDAAECYLKLGARVRLEKWASGIEIDYDKTQLGKWLLEAGPLQTLNEDLGAARKLERGGKQGKAYLLYQTLAAISSTNRDALAAAKGAAALADQAKAQLALADKALAEKDFPKGSGLLKVLAMRYQGCEFGKQAQKRLDEIKADPDAEAQMNRDAVNAKADALEAQAKKAEERGDYAAALPLYERYVKDYPQATRFQEVTDHLKTLKEDPAVTAKVNKGEAEHFCKRNLQLAESYVGAGKTDKARECLRNVIETHGQTPWAKRARERLAQLDGQ
ncbi:MAG: hypothetical protein LLG01_06290 [Planctomycetaceae bacterium]|nr:hypothetical protein [Planctomycetaceae bacterium]